SYVASLQKKGQDRILQKIGEEASEVIIAGKNNNKKMIISEMADLWFHLLVFLAAKNIPPEKIIMELEKRNK
ncbi:phosphoribosyl-ATP diphosphatase, partial [Candidatus Microgenomates bacterium]|nr:phosphoribosyl-ATP diphosphatase [Candidatus Microgenomates bacterium]